MLYYALLMLYCRSGDELIDVYKSFIAEFPVVTIEDPFDQDDWAHYTKLTAAVGSTQVPSEVCMCVRERERRLGTVY